MAVKNKGCGALFCGVMTRRAHVAAARTFDPLSPEILGGISRNASRILTANHNQHPPGCVPSSLPQNILIHPTFSSSSFSRPIHDESRPGPPALPPVLQFLCVPAARAVLR